MKKREWTITNGAFPYLLVKDQTGACEVKGLRLAAAWSLTSGVFFK